MTQEPSHSAFLEKLQDRLGEELSLTCIRLAGGRAQRWVRGDTRPPPCSLGSQDCSDLRAKMSHDGMETGSNKNEEKTWVTWCGPGRPRGQKALQGLGMGSKRQSP